MPKFLVVVFCVFCSLAGQSQILLVSDIDDTLKDSRSLNPTESLIRAYDITAAVPGMAEVFQWIESSKIVNFNYVSSAPEALMGESHESFLEFNKFPRGPLYLRSVFESSFDFKVRTIRNIISESRTRGIDQIVLIGDDARNDPQVYLHLRKAFADLKIAIFIKNVNPKAATLRNIVYYKSSVDLAEHLVRENIVSPEAVPREFGPLAVKVGLACHTVFL